MVCSDGFRVVSTTSPKTPAGTEAEDSRVAAETLATLATRAAKRKRWDYEIEAQRKWEQELPSIFDAMRRGLNPYGSKAWRAIHGVNIGMDCQGSFLQLVSGGSTIKSLFKKSPRECSAFCEETKGCIAWSWNTADVTTNCYAQNSCERRVPRTNMVSGLKASFNGTWYYKNISDTGGFKVDDRQWFRIDVDKHGEMIFVHGNGDHGKLAKPGGSRHDLKHRMDEMVATLECSDRGIVGTIRVRLTAGKIQLQAWRPHQDTPTYYIAEKKEVPFEPFQRVAVKADHLIEASDVHSARSDGDPDDAVLLKQGDVGTVVSVVHPCKTGVYFDQDPSKTVWVNDTLLVKCNVLEEVSEEEVNDVLESLGDDLIHSIRDPITFQVFRDPVVASDGYTYERSAMERFIAQSEELHGTAKSPMTNEPLSSFILSPNYAIKSLVASVVDKVKAARAASRKIQRRWRGHRARKAYALAKKTRGAESPQSVRVQKLFM